MPRPSSCQNDYDGGATWIVLGHLSESNNVPELARLSAEQALGNHPTLLGNRILLAGQAAPSIQSPCTPAISVGYEA